MSRLRRTLLRLALLAASVAGGVVAVCWAIVAILADAQSGRGYRVTIALDQTANAAFGGSEDETISSRAGRAQQRGERWACVLCRVLGWLQKDHCKRSIGL